MNVFNMVIYFVNILINPDIKYNYYIIICIMYRLILSL